MEIVAVVIPPLQNSTLLTNFLGCHQKLPGPNSDAMHPWMWQATRLRQAWLESWFTVSIGELQSDKTSLGNWARVGSGSSLRLLEESLDNKHLDGCALTSCLGLLLTTQRELYMSSNLWSWVGKLILTSVSGHVCMLGCLPLFLLWALCK